MPRPTKEFQMNLFKDFTLKWWQAGIFKVALLSLGIIIGSMWPELLRGWAPFFLVIFLISVSYVTFVWWKQ